MIYLKRLQSHSFIPSLWWTSLVQPVLCMRGSTPARYLRNRMMLLCLSRVCVTGPVLLLQGGRSISVKKASKRE